MRACKRVALLIRFIINYVTDSLDYQNQIIEGKRLCASWWRVEQCDSRFVLCCKSTTPLPADGSFPSLRFSEILYNALAMTQSPSHTHAEISDCLQGFLVIKLCCALRVVLFERAGVMAGREPQELLCSLTAATQKSAFLVLPHTFPFSRHSTENGFNGVNSYCIKSRTCVLVLKGQTSIWRIITLKRLLG